MRNKSMRVIVAGMLASALLLSGCAGAAEDANKGEGGEADLLAIGTMTSPVSLDTKDAGGSAIPFFQATYDTLIKREADGTFSPMLATEWSYNDDQTELSLTLRDDVTFADGTAFDATAVKANLEHFRDGGGQSSSLAAAISDITVTDATHVTLVLSAPDPGLVFGLSDGAGMMANPSKLGDESLATEPDGTGPYTLNTSETAIGTTWVFDRKDDYWGDDLPFKRITMSVFDNENAMVNGLKTGQLNAALLQTADQQIAAEADSSLTITKQDFDFQGFLLFDRDGAVTPALADVRVRQAINYAIDRQTLLDQIRQGRGSITSQVFGTTTQGYDEALDTYYSYDPAKAKELLAEAGYADGLTLTMPAVPGITSDAMTTALTTQLAEAGITLVWESPDNPLTAIFREFKYSGMVMNMGQSSNDWLVIQTLVLPGTFNFFGTATEESQRLVTEIQTTPVDEAQSLDQEMNTYLVEQAWFAPFYRMTYEHVTDASVTVVPQDGMAVPSIYNYTPAS